MPKPFTAADLSRAFPDEAACLDALFDARHERQDMCPGCMAATRFHRLRKRRCYACQRCGYQVHPLAGTIFHKSRTPLTKWFLAVFLFASSRNGVSARELQRQLGVTYKTAWRMARQIRTLFVEDPPGPMSGTVEADESWFGPKGRKLPVAGLAERGGRIRTKVVTDTDAATLVPWIEGNVAKGSLIATDEHRAYRAVTRRGYRHATVNHSRWQWRDADTGASTNILEGHWGLVKRSVRGTYGAISARHLPLYLAEFSWRANHRKDEEPFFSSLVRAAARSSRSVF